jgi:hypothetical protein
MKRARSQNPYVQPRSRKIRSKIEVGILRVRNNLLIYETHNQAGGWLSNQTKSYTRADCLEETQRFPRTETLLRLC